MGKTCPYCKNMIPDDSKFCHECGREFPTGKTCSYCGGAISDGDVFCQHCGNKMDEASNVAALNSPQKRCPYCGSPLYDDDIFCQNCGMNIEADIDSVNAGLPSHNKQGELFVKWVGRWFLFDSKVSVSINGIKQGDFSIKKGFEIAVPITSQETVVETKHAFYNKTRKDLFLNSNESYTYELVYNPLSGGFGSVFYDNNENELESYKVSWGWVILCFLLPILGIPLLTISKEHRKYFKNAIIAALIGFCTGILLNVWIGYQRNSAYQEAKQAREKFVADSLEQVRKDSIEAAKLDSIRLAETFTTTTVSFKKSAPGEECYMEIGDETDTVSGSSVMKSHFDVETEIVIDYPNTGKEVLKSEIITFILDALNNTFTWYEISKNPHYNGDLSDGQKIANFYGKAKIKELQKEGRGGEEIYIQNYQETDAYISYQVDFSGCHGGVGDGKKYGMSFNKSTGQRIKVIDNPENQYLKSMLISFVIDRIGEENLDLESLLSNPYPRYEPFLVNEGIRFVYQQYEIAAGYMGVIEITIPYKKISNYMTSDARQIVLI